MLLQEGPLQPADKLLAALALAPEHDEQSGLHPLYAAIVSHLPLTEMQWAVTPLPAPAWPLLSPSCLRARRTRQRCWCAACSLCSATGCVPLRWPWRVRSGTAG